VTRSTAVDRVPYLRARRIARTATVGFAVLAAGQARLLALLASSGGTSPVAVLPFLGLCVVILLAWFVLGRLWRRVGDLRPVILPVEAGAGALRGAPEQDAAEGRHLSLSGDVEPPTRW
jgi:hypothetical protein